MSGRPPASAARSQFAGPSVANMAKVAKKLKRSERGALVSHHSTPYTPLNCSQHTAPTALGSSLLSTHSLPKPSCPVTEPPQVDRRRRSRAVRLRVAAPAPRHTAAGESALRALVRRSCRRRGLRSPHTVLSVHSTRHRCACADACGGGGDVLLQVDGRALPPLDRVVVAPQPALGEAGAEARPHCRTPKGLDTTAAATATTAAITATTATTAKGATAKA